MDAVGGWELTGISLPILLAVTNEGVLSTNFFPDTSMWSKTFITRSWISLVRLAQTGSESARPGTTASYASLFIGAIYGSNVSRGCASLLAPAIDLQLKMANTQDTEWKAQMKDMYDVETIHNVHPPKDTQPYLSPEIEKFIQDQPGEVSGPRVVELAVD